MGEGDQAAGRTQHQAAVEEHDGLCRVPWGFSVSDEGDLALGIYAFGDEAREVVEGVRASSGGREVVLAEGALGRFEEAEQYRIERGG